VETLTGRRRRAPVTYNELINSPIQGTASDITVNAWGRLSRKAHKLDRWQYQARLEVHDELVFQVPKKTFDRDIEFIADHLLECRHFPFINVPLSIEISSGPNWYEQKEVKTLFSDDFGKIDRRECGF
jgi:DNA polymerase I-like protein with 3'-5' exonuclease and polymerase domains